MYAYNALRFFTNSPPHRRVQTGHQTLLDDGNGLRNGFSFGTDLIVHQMITGRRNGKQCPLIEQQYEFMSVRRLDTGIDPHLFILLEF